MASSFPSNAVLVELDDADFDWLERGEGQRHGLRLPPGGVDERAVLRIVRRMTNRLHQHDCRGAWMIVSGDEVVGLCSYRRPPENGEVEIGYGVAANRRGRGHATRAVEAMLAAARAAGLRTVRAETSFANPASGRVLQKASFERVGTRVDAEDGTVALWRIELST